MSYPKTYSAFRRTTGDLPHTIEQTQEELPEDLGPHDVIIMIHAVSLNYREIAMLDGSYPLPCKDGGVPCSDCAAEVVAIGSEVRDFAMGDAVASICGVGKYEGTDDGFSSNVGVDVEGVLREYAVFQDKHLVRLPKNMSWEDSSMLACAAVTAWNALDGLQHVPKHASALLQGTGGVSFIALILCIAAGIRPIITSSSDEKIAALQKLYPQVRGINYKTTSDQSAEVRRFTDGRGVDFVVNNAGPQSLIQDIGFLCERGGSVALVGFLQGVEGDWQPRQIMDIMIKSAKIKGIAVGSKADFEAMNRFLEEKNVQLTPALDRVFSFDESKAAYEYLASGKHTGKVVIKIQ